MKKKKTLLVTVIILLTVICGIVSAIIPSDDIKYYSSSQKKTLAESLVNVSSAKLNNKSLEITMDENNTNELVSSFGKPDEYRVILNNDNADIYVPVTFLKIINTNINISFLVKAEDNKLKFTVQQSKLGKVKINNKFIMKHVKNGNYNDVKIEKSGNDIYVSDRNIYFDDAYIRNNNIYIKCRLNMSGILNRLIKQII